MATYKEVNAAWPVPCPIPTGKEAITGVKRLIRVAHRHAKEEGVGFGMKKYQFKITSGRRHTWPHRGIWNVNPNEKRWNGQGGWAEIVHSVSHWATYKYWPSESNHSPRHVYIEKMLTDYAVKNFLDGQLKRPEKPKPDPIEAKRTRLNARIMAWEGKERRAANALRKLRKQAKRYA